MSEERKDKNFKFVGFGVVCDGSECLVGKDLVFYVMGVRG
jgi:hypothetical protein